MTRLTIMIRVIFAASLLLAGGTAHAQTQGATGDEASTACTHTFTKGTGDARLSYCVSEHANLMSFSAAGVEHIRVAGPANGFVDGYMVCSNDGFGFRLHGYDAAAAGESAWGANVLLTGPTATGVSYSRTTADGRIRLDHTFTMDPVEGDVTVTVKVTNSFPVDLEGVRYVRFSDFDADGTPAGDLWTRSRHEVEAVEGRGISLNAITFNTSHGVYVTDVNRIDVCDPLLFDAQPNGAIGDYVGYVMYNLGYLQAFKSKTVKFVYKRK